MIVREESTRSLQHVTVSARLPLRGVRCYEGPVDAPPTVLDVEYVEEGPVVALEPVLL